MAKMEAILMSVVVEVSVELFASQEWSHLVWRWKSLLVLIERSSEPKVSNFKRGASHWRIAESESLSH